MGREKQGRYSTSKVMGGNGKSHKGAARGDNLTEQQIGGLAAQVRGCAEEMYGVHSEGLERRAARLRLDGLRMACRAIGAEAAVAERTRDHVTQLREAFERREA